MSPSFLFVIDGGHRLSVIRAWMEDDYGDVQNGNSKITDEQKSKLFINIDLNNAITCPICNGYLDVDKSVSCDHIQRVREGGAGSPDNVQITHPYCNQSIKQ
jgi:hypothetical protein